MPSEILHEGPLPGHWQGRRLALAALLRVMVAAACAGPLGATAGVVEIGEPAPPLRGRLFDGTPFDLAQSRGRVVLVNFYSSYCSICAHEIGNIEAVQEQLGPKGLQILMVSIDTPDDLERTRRFVDNYHLSGTLAATLDANGFERRYPTPTCYVVDRDGIVREKLTGAKTGGFYRAAVLPLLAP